MNKRLMSIVGILAAVVLFVGANVLFAKLLRGARADLTQGKLYTLSQGSRNIAKKLTEPIKLTLYYSEKQSNDGSLSQFKSYGTRVKEVLQEYAGASNGKIELSVVNPEPFSEAEDKAQQEGLAGVPVGGTGSERFYFGLVGRNSTAQQQTVPFFDPRREEFLEYDLTRMIYLLSDPKKKVVGLMSWLPIEGVQGQNPMMRQGQVPPWAIVNQMKDVFEVKTLPTDSGEIPADVSVLMLVHPKGISEKTQYAIDQYVLKGGRALIFVDPVCEVDVPPGINPMQAMNIPKDSKLPKLFDAWGLEMVEGQFAADRSSAIRVNVGSPQKPETVDYVAYIQLDKDKLDKNDAVTGQVEQINFGSAGVLRKKGDAGTDFESLAQTSDQSMSMSATTISFMPDPKKMLADFVSTGKPLTVAARITGKVKTAFPNGRPAPAPEQPKPGEPPKPPPPATAEPDPNFVSESKDPINVIVVADCDMLRDNFWVQEARLGQITLGYNKFADNGDFVIGALDNLTGSSDLISVRARGKFQRPFDKVKEIQKDAEQKYLAKEQALQEKLRLTEQEINKLQRERPDAAGASNTMILTPEQKAKIENFRKEQAATHKELRDVQYQLRKDVEQLGTRVKVLNVGLMPVLVGCGAIGLSVWRVGRRRADRWKPKPRD